MPTLVPPTAPAFTVTPTSQATDQNLQFTDSPTVPPTFTPTPIPVTSVPTPLPSTVTPRPLLTLAIPPSLTEPVTAALSTFTADWDWQLLSNNEPKALLNSLEAQFALVEGTDGHLVHQVPMVLAVPFTTNWEEVSLEQMQDIVANGHQLVTIMPWTALTPDQKALRIDGLHPTAADYPLQQSWSLLAAAGYETAAQQLANHLTDHWPLAPIVHLVAVGDMMLDRSLGGALKNGNLEYPFINVFEPLRTADITIGNVESSLGDIGEPASKSYTFRAPPQAAPALALAGFDVVSLANNHGMDYGPETLLQGIQLLREADVQPVGAGANLEAARTAVIREVNGLRLAFLGYVYVPVETSTGFDTESWTATDSMPGLAWARPEWIREDVTAVRPQVDLVIVILHSGYEYIEAPSPEQVAAAQAAITAGADLVIGHHAHILQGIEFAQKGVIVYGLGNFAFVIDGPPETAILNVWLDADGVRQLELVPAIVGSGGQPRLAEPWEAGSIRQRVYQLTNLLN